jgi:hypothetical protein
MNHKELYTTKDFREGRIAIKFNGNRQLLKEILMESCNLKEEQIDSVCMFSIANYTVLYYENNELIMNKISSFNEDRCVSEFDVFLVKSKKHTFIQRLIKKFTT